jgi:O-antigen/teichoic acid export membrane protein
MWGLTILLIVSIAFAPASLQAIGWYTHHMQFGFPITGTFWGFGIATGTYIGDKVGRDHSHFSNVFRNRLFGGIGGVVCFSVVSPLVFGFFFEKNTASQHFMPRAWSDAFDQALSVCAILTCFYVLKRRLASTFAAFESARLRHR